MSAALNSSTDSGTTAPPPANTPAENAIAGTFILLISAVGLAANITAIVCSLREESARKQVFTKIFLSLAFADTLVLVPQLLVVSPLLYSQSAYWSTEPFLMGTAVAMALTGFFASNYSALMMAVNRFVAVFLPLKFNDMYEPRWLYIQIGTCWIVALGMGITYGVPGCGFAFAVSIYAWYYPATLCGSFMSIYFDVISHTVILSVQSILSIVTYLKLRRGSKKVASTATVRSTFELERQKSENAFLAQSCISCFVFVLLIFLFHCVAQLVSGKWAWYWVTTFAWPLAHFSNGFVYLFLMPKIRANLWQMLKCGAAAAKGSQKTKTTTATAL